MKENGTDFFALLVNNANHSVPNSFKASIFILGAKDILVNSSIGPCLILASYGVRKVLYRVRKVAYRCQKGVKKVPGRCQEGVRLSRVGVSWLWEGKMALEMCQMVLPMLQKDSKRF